MERYRIYFRSQGMIRGREDYAAKDGRSAMHIAEFLCDACSDVCDSFELWQDGRRVDTTFSRVPVGPARLNAKTQEIVIELEERLRESEWAVAQSHRLLQQTKRLTEMSGQAPLNN